MKRSQNLVAFLSGTLFALGLALSGMTQPVKVLGFLDVLGEWDPTLVFVMIGAIVVHFVFAQIAQRPDARPLIAPRFVVPTRSDIDAPLVLGAILFGVGWGLAGFCPGPAVVSLLSLSATTWLFVAAMLVGMLLYGMLARLLRTRSTRDPSGDEQSV